MSEEEQEDNQYDEAEQRAEINAETAEAYGSPTPEEKINQFKIISDALKSKENIKTTWLKEEELGKPMFSTRFYLDCASISNTFGSPLVEEYFRNKTQNIASSGMSREGFTMKLNVTNRREVNRKNQRSFKDKEEENAP